MVAIAAGGGWLQGMWDMDLVAKKPRERCAVVETRAQLGLTYKC